MSVKNSDLPLNLQHNTKSRRVRKGKRKLGNGIEIRTKSVYQRKDFGKWKKPSLALHRIKNVKTWENFI